MTDRFSTLTVILEKDTRSDDAQAMMDAIGMMRGVLKVVGGNVDPTPIVIAGERVRHELFQKIHDIFWKPHNG
jgi:hypothetical protein